MRFRERVGTEIHKNHQSHNPMAVDTAADPLCLGVDGLYVELGAFMALPTPSQLLVGLCHRRFEA